MPVGHPKDPVAHAAKLAANAQKRAEARKSDDDLENLRSKLTGQPVRKRKYTQQGTKNTVTIGLEEVVKSLEDKLKSREAKIEELEELLSYLQIDLTRCADELSELRVSRAKAEDRLFTVLDLAARIF